MPGYAQCLITSQVDGAAYGNSTTANTPLQPAAAALTVPTNFFYIGKKLRMMASGRISNTVTAVNLTLGVAFGTLATPIIVFNGGTNSLVARATTNVTWNLEIDLICRAIGSGTSANMFGIGQLCSEACPGSSAGVATTQSLPLSAPAVGTGFDSTITNVIQLVATWGTAAAGNTITCHLYELTDLNYTP